MTTRLLMTADAVGGVWQYATELARALVPHGVETTIAVLGPAPTPDQARSLSSPPWKGGVGVGSRAEGVPTLATRPIPDPSLPGRGVTIIPTDLPLDWLAPGPEPVLAAGRALADLAREIDADIVHLNSPTLAAAARFDQPVVAVAHGCVATWWRAAPGCHPDQGYRWQADLMRRGLLAADAVVAPSAAFAADLRRTYALPYTPSAVHNGRSPVAVAGQGKPANCVFTAGRLWDRVKNTDVLDRAAARLSAPIRVAGPTTGPNGEFVAPRHLRLLGTLSGAELAAELATQPIFVSAASFEPFGLAVLEAAQAGCALILSDIPTFRELWDGAALFVPVGDDAALAAAVDALLSDQVRRVASGGSAQARAGRYRPERMAAHMDGIYAGLPARAAA